MNTDDLHESMLAATETMLLRTLKLEARCAALEAMTDLLAMKCGYDLNLVHEKLQTVRDAHLQKALEEVQKTDQGLAARIDTRAEMPDIPDELL